MTGPTPAAAPDAPRKRGRAAVMFGVWMPAMLLLTLAGYFVLGVLPGALLTGDFIAALAELPLITMHAMAAVGMAWLFNRATFLDLDNAAERALCDIVQSVDRQSAHGALSLLYIDLIRRLVPLCVFALFFYPAR